MKLTRKLILLSPILIVLGLPGALRLAAQHVVPRTLHMQVTATGLQFTITASPSANLAGYNVWCGTATGGPYATNVNSPTLIPTTAPIVYTWTAGTPNTTYYCVARAVDIYGQASANSTQASGSFPLPAPPLPPAGLAIP